MKTGSAANSRPRFRRVRVNGFALVATLMLVLLIVVIAVGLLQLATISLRTVNYEGSLSQARANARMSLMLAIGQLQQELGPDRRISAPAGVLDTDPATAAVEGVNQPHWTGVWTATESPFAKWALDRPNYDKKAGFRRWLVSGNPEDVGRLDLATAGPAAGGQTCNPVPNGPDAGSQRGVNVPVLEGPCAGFAWWTSDDGVKAVLSPGEKPDSSSKSTTLLAMRRADSNGHAAVDPKFPDRDHGMDQRLVSLATVDAAVTGSIGADRVSSKHIHDLTTRSETVPVDVTTGGLRKCMNLHLDWLGTQSPAARAAAGTVGKMRGASMDYRLFSWDQLRNYESLARAGSMVRLNPATGRPEIRTYQQTGDTAEAEWNPSMSEDRFRVQPVLQKFAVMVSCGAEKLPSPPDPEKPYALRLHFYPIAVLWNPYNVDLVVNEYTTACYYPLVLNIKIGEAAHTLDLLKCTNEHLAFGPEMGGSQAYKPLRIPAGATKVLYPQPVRLDVEHRAEHRTGVASEYYMWAQMTDPKLDYSEKSNYGGVLKNLKDTGNPVIWKFDSSPNDEICGAADDQISLSVVTSGSNSTAPANFGINAAHSDWWGNNGPKTAGNSQNALHKFNCSTWVNYQITGQTPQISVISEGEVPVHTVSNLATAPQPVLLYECYRKAADENTFPAKMGSFSVAGNAIHPAFVGGTDNITPWFESPYTFKFKAITSTIELVKAIQTPVDQSDRIFFGASYKSDKGQQNVVDQEIPLSPLVSLAELQHLPLFDYRPTYDDRLQTFVANSAWYAGDHWFHLGRFTQFAQNHAIGNSYASPGIPSDKLTQAGWDFRYYRDDILPRHLRTDRSYIANAVLWDTWFCSTLGAQDGLMLTKDGQSRSARQVAEELFSGANRPPNDAIAARPVKPAKEILDSLFGANGAPVKDAYQKLAGFLRIEGGFNINSVSEEAWTHFLCGQLSRPHLVMESLTGSEPVRIVAPEKDKFLIARHSLSNDLPAERAAGIDRDNRYWNGSREVTKEQIRELAAAIVVQVKKRGPFCSLAEFVNRRLSGDAELAVSGALQSALDDPKVSINETFRGDSLTGTESIPGGKPTYAFAAAVKGPRRQGIAGYVTQADLLQSHGSRITPRSDTFTIRAMGEAKDTNGTVRSRVWCEAVIQRTAAYVDPSEDPSTPTTSLKQSANVRFGRHFEIVSFRWLNPQELQSQQAPLST